jgi:non-ribosomal peptide synthetase component F
MPDGIHTLAPRCREREPSTSSVIDGFDVVAHRFPKRLAIQNLTCRLTYSELADMIERIAAVTSAAIAERPGPLPSS